jgi:hypothetical protein
VKFCIKIEAKPKTICYANREVSKNNPPMTENEIMLDKVQIHLYFRVQSL